jgi:hypothetical protein
MTPPDGSGPAPPRTGLPAPGEADVRLARAVRATLAVMAATFDRAQAAAGRSSVLRLDALSAAAEPARDTVARGFALARAEGWLGVLCAQCVGDRVVERGFVEEAAAQTADPALVSLQGLVRPGSPFHDAALLATGILSAMDQVCRIEVDGAHRGTGFLIRPDLVMTAGHVISPPRGAAPLLDGQGRPLPGAAARVAVKFDDRLEMVNGARRRIPPVPARLAENWLVRRVAPADGAAAGLDEGLDYAVLRLAASPKPDLAGLAAAAEPPFPADALLLLQHPEGDPLKYFEADVRAMANGGHAFFHSANTLGGSSGAPCFNHEFQLVGIHQGEIADPAAAGAPVELDAEGRPRRVNVAILLSAALADTGGALDAPSAGVYLRELLLQDGRRWPVLDRRDFQDWVRASVLDGESRILAVPPADRGQGMSFLVEILQAMLPADRHRVARLSADLFQGDGPVAFAGRLLAALGADGALGGSDGDTTDAAWLRREFAPALVERLDAARDGRLIWIALDDLRVTLADRTGLRELLDLLYEQSAARPWLRFVLLGYGGAPPAAARPLMAKMTLDPIDLAEAEAYFEEHLAPFGPPERLQARRDNFAMLMTLLRGAPEPGRLAQAGAVLSQLLETQSR